MAAESASEVRGPEAMMTVPSAGIDVTSLSITVMFGWLRTRSVTRREKPWRSTGERAARLHARLVRAGEDQRAEAAQLLLEQSHRVSSRSERREFEQHSSANSPLWCAGVIFAGFIS